jgi:hypothetical protein
MKVCGNARGICHELPKNKSTVQDWDFLNWFCGRQNLNLKPPGSHPEKYYFQSFAVIACSWL